MGKKFKDLGNVVMNKHIESTTASIVAHKVQEDRGIAVTHDVQEVHEVHAHDVQEVHEVHAHDVQEVQEVREVKQVQDVAFSSPDSSLTLGTTQGIKGKKLPRINMAFSSETYEYIKRESRIRGLSATAFVNYIIEEYKKEPDHISYQS